MLSIALPTRRDTVRVRAFDRDVAGVSRRRPHWRALVGIDLDVKPGTYPVTVEAGRRRARALRSRRSRRAFPHAPADRNEAFVTPPPSEQARIDREAALLAGVWNAPAGERLWTGPFVRPVPQEANSAFGTRSIFNGKPRNAHGGADFLSPAGTPIHAPNAGRIVVARNLYFSGNTVIIDHGLGLFSMLAHLSAIDVHEGDA